MAPPRPPGAASPVPSAGPNRGVAKLVGAVVVFVVCSIIQVAGGSSMFDPSYDPSTGFVLGLLVNLTFYPGWLLTAGLVVSGVKELANRS